MAQFLRWPRLILLLLLPIILAATGGYLAFKHGWGQPGDLKYPDPDVDPDLAEVQKEIDRADPGWEFDNLNEHRTPVPAEDNSARHVEAAARLLPPNWPRSSLVDFLNLVPTNEALSSQQAGTLAEELKKAAAAQAEARKLSDQCTGRFTVAWQGDYLSTDMSHLKRVQAVEQLLRLDAHYSSQEGRADDALAAARRVLDAGRSIGDEPMLQSCLVRMGSHMQAARLIERVLAQGQPGSQALSATQQLLQDEAAQNLLLIAARGERAGLHGLLRALEHGDIKLADLSSSGNAAHPTLEDTLIFILSAETINKPQVLEKSHAWLLLYVTDFVDIAKLPVEEQKARLEELESRRAKAPLAARKLAPAVREMALTAQQSQAFLRCAAAALAVERFRREKGDWPQSLSDLAPDFLSAAPLDPFDGQPLRFKRQQEGVVVYSLGADGHDDGGSFDTLNTFRSGTDLGFRLWDVDKRRKGSAP
jgi:hypothetical protein